MNYFNNSFRFTWKQFSADLLWAFDLLRSGRKDASVKRAVRFVLRGLTSVRSTALWLNFLRESNLLATSVSEATFVDRIHRPFFDKRCSTDTRTDYLCSHFSILAQLLDEEQLHKVISGVGITLSTLFGKSGEIVELNLVRLPSYDREGGASIELCVNGRAVLLMTFTLIYQHQHYAIKIGGIQAKEYPDADSRSLMRDTTHALYGIQPRILMIETLRHLAKQLGCESIECIHEQNHIYRALRYRNKKTIHAQYNVLWEIVGGALNAQGNFSIPSSVPEKPIESRPSKKRNEYRHRALLIEAIRTQMNLAIQPALVFPQVHTYVHANPNNPLFSPVVASLETT